MHFVFTSIVILLAAAWIVAFPCFGYSLAKTEKGWSRCCGIFGAALATIGGIGFFGTALAALGMCNWLPRTFEWPVGYVGGVVTTQEGLYVVPHSPSSRIQIYDGDWVFKTGWFLDGRSGPIKISRVDDDELEVVANHSRRRFVYKMSGELISSSPYAPMTYGDFPSLGVTRFVPTSPWLLIFSHPLASFAAGLCGMAFLGKASAKRTHGKGN